MSDLTVKYPCLFFLDDNNHSTGEVVHYCSTKCRNQGLNQISETVRSGDCSDFIEDSQCASCGVTLAKVSPQVIFSSSYGFWQVSKGWVWSMDGAEVFSDQEDFSEIPLTEVPKGDVRIVPKINYSHVSQSDIASWLAGAVVDKQDGHDVAAFINDHTELKCVYQGDSLWMIDGEENLTGEAVEQVLIDEFMNMSSECIEQLYNHHQTDIAYYDGNEGFYHEFVATL